ncbi:MAG: hypothetical protein JO185_02135 [Acidobacteriaceae bacterium]|nr:hypothetical protein [Acidobacteriaceae bacterium]
MNWELIVQCSNLALGILLIIRLFSTKLYKVYKPFCIFLITDLIIIASWVLSAAFKPFSGHFYLLTWLIVQPLVWLFTLLMVYSLLERILVQLPGVLRLSKRVLHGTFLLAILIGLVSAWFEYRAPGFIFQRENLLTRFWVTELVFDRVVASTALLSLVAILIFLLWFPITIPRNLAVFSVGLVIYFAAITGALLARSLWPNGALPAIVKLVHVVSTSLGGISGACFAFWIFYLSPSGEKVESKIAIQRQPQEQERLIAQLELLNATLLKAARR